MDISRLKSLRLFAGLSSRELEAVVSRGSVRSLRKHTVFIERDDTASTLFLILSGTVKVFHLDDQGREQVLGIRGPGEHLGELALLTDAVRTASAVTLEDVEMLVLTRRSFVECLSDCPQLALNLDESLEERALSPDIGETAAAHYRAWSRFRHSGLPLIVLIGGCTGTGKSTVAAELALRLDIGRTLSTDILREVVRLFVPEHAAPELHTSSYEAWRVLRQEANERGERAPLIEGFRAQSYGLSDTIEEVIKRSVKERASTIIEGIHLLPELHRQVSATPDALVVPVLLTNPAMEELKRHFVRRGQVAPSRTASRYLNNFSAIWQLQEFLIEEARHCGVTVVPNTVLDETIPRVIGVITERLAERFL